MVTVADNQRGIARRMTEGEAALDGGALDRGLVTRLRALVESLLSDPDLRRRLAQAASALVDGRGALRIALAILDDDPAKDGAQIRLRLAQIEDENWLLDLQRQPQTRRPRSSPSARRRPSRLLDRLGEALHHLLGQLEAAGRRRRGPAPRSRCAWAMPTRAAVSASASASALIRWASPSASSLVLSASASASVRICAACCTRALVLGLALVRLDRDRRARDSVSACCCARAASASRSSRSLTGGLLLPRVGLDLLLGDLPRRAAASGSARSACRPAPAAACRSAPPAARGCSARTCSFISLAGDCSWIVAAVLDAAGSACASGRRS